MPAGAAMTFALLLVSVATPLVSQDIADRWFKLPDAIGLLPVPMGCALAILGMIGCCVSHRSLRGYGWFIFVALMVICLMAAWLATASTRHRDRSHDPVGGCSRHRVTAVHFLGCHCHVARDPGLHGLCPSGVLG